MRLFIKYITGSLGFLILNAFYTGLLYAQDSDWEFIGHPLEQQAEWTVEKLNVAEFDFSTYHHPHPLDLNHATRSELEDLFLLNAIQINDLLEHINKNGKLLSIHELQSIQSFDLQTIQQILPYVTLKNNHNSPEFNLQDVLKYGKHEVLVNCKQILEKQKGYRITDTTKQPEKYTGYLGSPQKLLQTYRFKYYNTISWGLSAEKDPGEEFFKGTQRQGFDFYSAFIHIKKIRFIRSLVIGDYEVGLGQGLTSWPGFDLGISSEALSVKKSGTVIRPHSSVDENRFMRGAGTTIAFKSWELTGFFSRKRIDAFIDPTFGAESVAISSFPESGLHNTPNSIRHKQVVSQSVWGGNIAFKKRSYSVGTSFMHTILGSASEKSSKPYNSFAFTGRHHTSFSIDYNLTHKNFNFFGETALSNNRGIALLNGFIACLDPRFSLFMTQRWYQKEYQALWGNAFGENTSPSNEKGIYLGLFTKPTTKLGIIAYIDRFAFPWLKYQVNTPSRGYDCLMQVNVMYSKKLNCYFRIKTKTAVKNTGPGNTPMVEPGPFKQINYRYHISYTITANIELRNRIELIQYKAWDKKEEKGFLIYQDVIYKPVQKPLSVAFRYALFETGSYATRIYAYENSIPYAPHSIPSYNNTGCRNYVILGYEVTKKITLWIRFSQTFYTGQKNIGKGSLNEIEGNTQSDLQVQFRAKL